MAEDPAKLTEMEKKVFTRLAQVMTAYADLPVVHPSHDLDVVNAVHVIQRVVMSRVARRTNPDVFAAVAGG